MHSSQAPQLGRFRIDAELARGGMGAVFSAFDTATGQQVALKRLAPDAPEAARALFEREYCVLLSLRHPRIIEVYEYGLDAEGPFYTMELLDGSDLRELAPMPAAAACRYMRDVASSLALLHARRLLHRDVSARNVRTRPDGSCKLIDFGALMSFGATDQVVGTPPAIPPEALSGQALDQRTDLYSLGALGYHLLTGRQAYPARSVQALPDAWASQVVPPSYYAKDIPAELEALILQLLSLDVLGRPSSAAEVIDRINAIANLDPDHDTRIAHAYFRGAQLIERGRELDRAERAIARLKESHGRTWVIEGRAGVGKTRLLGEVALRAQLAGVLVLRVDAAAHVGRMESARALLAQLVRLHPQLAAKVLPEQRQQLLEVWPGLFSIQSDAPQGAQHSPSEDAWARIPGLIEERLLALTREQPLMLAIDNVPQADTQSAATLMALARRSRGAPLLLVTTARLPMGEPTPALRGLYDAATTMVLRELTAQGTLQLMRSAFGDIPQAQRTARRLYQATRGNPEHSLQLLERWVTDGVVQYVGGGFSLPLTLPPSALLSSDQVANDRLTTCSPAARTLACAIAQLAEPVALETCVAIQAPENDNVTVHSAIDELLRAEVLEQNHQGLRFHNKRLRELAGDALPDAARAQLCERIAEHLLEASDGTFEQQAQAGLQLLRAGHRMRGASLIAAAARAAVSQDFTPARLAGQADALEAALAIYRHEGRSELEQLDLLVPLVQAAYEISLAFALRYGDATLAALERSLGLDRLRGKDVVSLEELLGALSTAPVIPEGQTRPATTPDPLTLITWLVRSVVSLVSVSSAAIDHEAEARFVAPLRPFRALGPTNAAAVVYDFCQQLISLTQDRFAEAHRGWTEMLERLKLVTDLPQNVIEGLLIAATFALALLECQLDDDRALERFKALEKFDTPRTTVMLAQLGFLFHVFRGDIEKANECRERLEAHAVQHGSAWQMEVWSSCTSNAAFGNTRDVAGNKRALAQLDRLRRQIPSLEQYWERAAATQQLLAGAPSRAAQMLEAILATAKPRERVGWGAVRGALAAAYNEHGEHARALAISEETIRVCAEDLDYVAMLLRSQMEHCRALGGLGQHEAAQARLTELFERFLPNNNPVTLGMLHCVAAELAQRRADIIEFEHHLNMMHKYFDPTRNPALIAQIDRLRNLQTGAVTSPHDQQDTSTITTGAQPFNTLLTTAYGTIERKQRALELVASQTDASQAYLFTRGWHDEPVMLSALGGVDPNPQVLEAVRSMFEAIPTDNDETAMASVASVASTTTAEPIHGHRLLPLTIVHEHKRMLIGAIAVCGGHHYRPVSHALLSELALQLYRAGDMISARTLG